MRMFVMSLAVCGVLAVGTATYADSIGVNFGADNAGGTDQGGNAFLAAGETAGFVSQANWNNALDVSGTLADVVADTGAATTLDVTWAAGESWNWNTPLGSTDSQLVTGWISTNTIGEATTVDISEIPYASYDMYLYVGHDRADNMMTVSETNGAFATFTTTEDVTADTAAAVPFVYQDAFNGIGNYAKVSGLSASTLNLSFVGDTNRMSIAGFQIVESAAIPEPTSLALLGLGSLAGLIRRRK